MNPFTSIFQNFSVQLYNSSIIEQLSADHPILCSGNFLYSKGERRKKLNYKGLRQTGLIVPK